MGMNSCPKPDITHTPEIDFLSPSIVPRSPIWPPYHPTHIRRVNHETSFVAPTLSPLDPSTPFVVITVRIALASVNRHLPFLDPEHYVFEYSIVAPFY